MLYTFQSLIGRFGTKIKRQVHFLIRVSIPNRKVRYQSGNPNFEYVTFQSLIGRFGTL